LTNAPNEASLILFVENHPQHDPFFRRVHNHPLRRQYPNKCVLYHDADLSVTWMPTLSPSVQRSQVIAGVSAPHNYLTRMVDNDAVNAVALRGDTTYAPSLLASFVGSSATHPVRRRIVGIKAPGFMIKDTATDTRRWLMDAAERAESEQTYVDTILKSAFVLCPRGYGPSSYRLYEAMRLGRCPVVISDEWAPPAGVNWKDFVLHVRERDVALLPTVLNQAACSAEERGAAARSEWIRCLSDEVVFSHIVSAAECLLGQSRPRLSHLRVSSQLIRGRQWRTALKRIVRTGHL
jgi:hypothetical protein